MIDFPEDARERELRILVARLQYERYLANLTADLVEREFNRVLDVLLSGRYRDLTAFQRQRTAALFGELDRIIRSGYAAIANTQIRELQGYAQLEADVARATARAILSAGASQGAVGFYRLPATYLASIAKLPIQGLQVGEWYEAQAQTMSVNTRRLIQQSLVQGKSPAEMSRRILAPDTAATPPLSRRAKQEARIITRTAVNAVQNDATRASNAALPRHLSDSYMIVAVRDSRTSAICRAKDGVVFKYDEPAAQYPPFHIACRTTTKALLRGASETLAAQKTPATMRGYSAWLRSKPDSVQNGILGPTRAQWFRDGRMSLAEAIDADNRILTLPQLRAKLGLTEIPHE